MLVSCASPPFKRLDLQPEVRQCLQFYDQADAVVREAGVTDAESARIRGFPYLRTDRFLANLGQQTLSAEQFEAWIDRLERLDREARRIEYRNLPPEDRQSLAPNVKRFVHKVGHCATLLRRQDGSVDSMRATLQKAAQVSPNYSTAQRVFGLYPLTAVFMSRGVRHLHREIREAFAQPLEALPVRGKLMRYGPPETARLLSRQEVVEILERARNNPLGIPEPDGKDEARLLHTFAPVWEIDVISRDDHIGTPTWHGREVRVDVDQPVVYTRLSYTRFNAQTLLQLSYIIWFPARTQEERIDPLAGHLDGLTWRVTLAPDGAPLIYDTIHNCGCYHMFFPTERLEPIPEADAGEEPLLVPQQLVESPSRRLVIRLAGANHYIQRVYSDARGENTTYALQAYRTLRSLPTDERHRHSLFAPNGLVLASQRGERWFLWPSGVKSPGAMRQWGHHAVAFLGRRHFDEPDLIARYFRLRESPTTSRLTGER
jgi:hypothetical protein